MQLDQFYTKPRVAHMCWCSFVPILTKITNKDISELFFIEPSAGKGDFYELLPPGKGNRMAVDIEPMREDFVKKDFLTWNRHPLHASRQHTVIIGNPPFGTRGNMAVQFLNKSAEIADTIAFILPVIFRKYFIHKRINTDLQWIYSADLPRGAFYTPKKDTYEVNTEFQVWTRLNNNYQNKRLFEPPPISHQDFIMHQYNNTNKALKVFDNDFDFAVPSQGWQDYNRRETKAEKCEKHKQWILFKAATPSVHERLYEGIDFPRLAMKNTTSIPGFRKGDVVQEYLYQYG